jgi:hypothetical protein
VKQAPHKKYRKRKTNLSITHKFNGGLGRVWPKPRLSM